MFRPIRVGVDLNAALNGSSLAGSTFGYKSACPDCDQERFRHVYYLLATQYPALMHSMKTVPVLKASLENGLCGELGFEGLGKENDTKCLESKLLSFYKTLFGTCRIVALCNVVAVERGLLAKAESQPFPAVLNEKPADTSVKNQTEDPSQSPLGDSSKSDEVVSVPKGDTPAAKESDKGEEKNPPEDNPSNSSPPAGKDNSSEKMTASKSERETNSNIPSPNKEEVLKDPPPVVHVSPTSSAHVTTTTATSGGSVSGEAAAKAPENNGKNGVGTNGGGAVPPLTAASSQGQRESVWQKLSNKIKVGILSERPIKKVYKTFIFLLRPWSAM